VWGQTGDSKGKGGGAAGVFFGGVSIEGDLIVSGAKFAAIKHRDGSRRVLYALESPECWFEDFGEARLTRGKVKVKVRADFGAVVDSKEYHVFLTAYGDTDGLYVARRDRSSFEVREQHGGKSNVTFSYRIVARRKDLPRERMPKSTLLDTVLRKVNPPARMPAPPQLEVPKRRPLAPVSTNKRSARSPRGSRMKSAR
jgi:hypothetical protein